MTNFKEFKPFAGIIVGLQKLASRTMVTCKIYPSDAH